MSKISLWKNGGPSEDHRQKVKTRMGNQIRILDKKTTTTSKNTETEHENIFGKSTTKTHRDKTKQFRQNKTFQNNEEKILPTNKRRMSEDMPATRCERGKMILEQNMGTERS